MSMYSFIGFMAIIIFATILACGYAILKRIDEIDEKWKPSEEQMEALNFAITYFMHETNYKNPTELRDLYEQLKKL